MAQPMHEKPIPLALDEDYPYADNGFDYVDYDALPVHPDDDFRFVAPTLPLDNDIPF